MECSPFCIFEHMDKNESCGPYGTLIYKTKTEQPIHALKKKPLRKIQIMVEDDSGPGYKSP